MKILGIDTSTKTLSIALNEDRKTITEKSLLLDRRHSSLMIPYIKAMLEKNGFSIETVDAVVVGLGPGSFTGLRIGVSVVKGFGLALKKPCIGIASIDALAMNVDKDATIVPIIDAKRENLYSAIYKKKKGRLVKKTPPLLLGVPRLMKKIKGPAIFLGDGITLYRDKIQDLNKDAIFLDEESAKL